MHKLDPIERLPHPSSTQKDFAAAKSAARASSLALGGQNTALPAPRRFIASRRQNPPANGGRV
jgi:hypothetical protein